MMIRELPRDSDDDEEVWVTHYSSNHQILLVGEGDFSFSCSLATSFGSASNICASSLDSYDDVVRKYKKARSNLETLKKLGALVLHGVDATKLRFYPDLNARRFDRVIFNFPHAGFHGKETDSSVIRKHRELVFGFFHGASHMLRANGEIHVSHKITGPFCRWNLEELASRCFLALIQRVAFEKSDYPGYENKRGDGSRCDIPFPLGECSTFKFRFCRVAKELYAEKVKWREEKERESKCPQALITNHQPVLSFDTQFQGVSQRPPVSFDLRQVQDPLGQSRLRQVQDLLVQSRLRQVQDHLVQSRQQPSSFEMLNKHICTERSSLQFQESRGQASQELCFKRSYHFNGVSHGFYNGEVTRTSSAHPYMQPQYLDNFDGYSKVTEARIHEQIFRNRTLCSSLFLN